ncbi:glyoxylate/hydroxypyruvate reductase A [Thiotrichales bacterium 19S3-7]|nr:glyoxylate/hydroxypyruvate reductase A [Thiotrichales bacterium 19S3-7]MCF6802346.1 glyoxylate/hydroxypyruvate reductase A [Thiotrichales bacterium 19S3-11]
MSIALIIGKDETERKRREKQISLWHEALSKLIDHVEIHIYPAIPEPEAVEFAVCWSQPEGVFNEFPNLKCISSSGAGVNHLVNDNSIKDGVAIVRVADPKLSRDMAHYVIQAALNHTREYSRFKQSQQQKYWDQFPPFNTTDKNTVGVMGIGEIGSYIAQALSHIQIPTIGYSRSKKIITGIETYEHAQLDTFLNLSHILVCTLPLTSQTTGIINQELINKLPDDAYIINIGRGAHINEADLLNALDNNKLSGAKLDVFNQEPLAKDHPFWSHPKIELTPHNAAVSDPFSAAICVADNYKRMQSHQPLCYQVNKEKGY